MFRFGRSGCTTWYRAQPLRASPVFCHAQRFCLCLLLELPVTLVAQIARLELRLAFGSLRRAVRSCVSVFPLAHRGQRCCRVDIRGFAFQSLVRRWFWRACHRNLCFASGRSPIARSDHQSLPHLGRVTEVLPLVLPLSWRCS